MGEKGNDPAAAAAGLTARMVSGSGATGGMADPMGAMQAGSQQLGDMKAALEKAAENPLPPPNA